MKKDLAYRRTGKGRVETGVDMEMHKAYWKNQRLSLEHSQRRARQS